jgi:hypothetical protein
MGAIKPEFPPLLPFGFHLKTEQELHEMLVVAFPLSTRRAALWQNLLWLVDELKSRGIKCRLWLDGSYLTKKIDPDDIDLIVEVSIDKLQNATPKQQELLEALSQLRYHDEPKKLHTFVIFTAPIGHVARPQAEKLNARWTNDFGYSLVKREPKGIALMEVAP